MAEVVGRVYRAASGQWSFEIVVDGVQVCGGCGFDFELSAYEEMYERLSDFS